MERSLSSWHFPLQMMLKPIFLFCHRQICLVFHVMPARATAVFAQYTYRHVL